MSARTATSKKARPPGARRRSSLPDIGSAIRSVQLAWDAPTSVVFVARSPTLSTVPRPTIFQLLGFPGVGKLTVGRELIRLLEARGETARLIDNHLTQNLIVDLVENAFSDGVREPRLVEPIGLVRAAIRQTIEQLSPRSWSFVFTNFPSRSSPSTTIFRNREVALHRGSAFLPVLLECRPDELVRRVQDPERSLRSKLRDPETLASLMRSGIDVPAWPELVRLDVSDLTALDTALRILALQEHE
ncbi:MAG TPA: hypothetical protein VIJ34_10485 [Acidimicrobiales bacterium]